MPKTIFSAGQEKLQNLLKSTRESAGLTQTALAKKLKRPQSFVSKYECGESGYFPRNVKSSQFGVNGLAGGRQGRGTSKYSTGKFQ